MSRSRKTRLVLVALSGTFILLLSSCARPYNTIRPQKLTYGGTTTLTKSVTISYQNDVQLAFRNKPALRKEKNKYIKLIAINIQNNGQDTIMISADNLNIYGFNNRLLNIIPLKEYHKKTRQSPEQFTLFYGLLGFGASWGEVNGQRFTTITYNFIPLIIGLMNAMFAGIFNSDQKKNLEQYDILGKDILPGERKEGLIALDFYSPADLRFELNQLK